MVATALTKERTKMSNRYACELDSLTLWFRAALSCVPKFVITRQQYAYGVDSLPSYLKDVCNNAFHVWLTHRNYEISYNQMCIAFFSAAKHNDKMRINA
jgi:hypothetical protein